jgi:hypothetical protein
VDYCAKEDQSRNHIERISNRSHLDLIKQTQLTPQFIGLVRFHFGIGSLGNGEHEITRVGIGTAPGKGLARQEKAKEQGDSEKK